MRLMISLISTSKFFFILYMVFSQVIKIAVFQSSGMSMIISYLLLMLAILSQLVCDKKLIINNAIKIFVLFGVFELLSSLIVATDRYEALSTLFLYFEFMLVMYLINRYVDSDNSIEFPLYAYILTALVMAFFQIFRGAGIKRISISDSLNVNTVGVQFMFAVGFLLYLFIRKKKTIISISLYVGIVLLFVYCILLTVSKKSILGVLVLIVFWALVCYRDAFIRINPFFRILLVVAIIATGYFAFIMFATRNASIQDNILLRFSRINDMSDNLSSGMRVRLIEEGFQTFLNHPFLGVGFNNSRYYNSLSTYTHCFYIEVLACSGAFGTVLFASGLGTIGSNLRRKKRENNYVTKIEVDETKYMIVIFWVIIALGAVQIFFYMHNIMYAISVLSSYGYLIYSNQNQQ